MPESRPSSTTVGGIASIFVSLFLFDTKTVLMWWQNVKDDKNRKKASVLSVCTFVYTGFFQKHAVILEHIHALVDFKFYKILRHENNWEHVYSQQYKVCTAALYYLFAALNIWNEYGKESVEVAPHTAWVTEV